MTVLKFDTGERITAKRMLKMLADVGQAEVSKGDFDQWLKARNGKNKERVKVRQERERKGAAAPKLYPDDAPADLQKVFSDICAQLSIVGPAGDSQRATCPSCEDPSPSFIFGLSADKILMTCHAGCTFAEICEAVGVEQKHCFARKKTAGRASTQAAPGADDQAGAEDGNALSLAQLLIKLARDKAELFHDAGGDAYLTATVCDHRENYRLNRTTQD